MTFDWKTYITTMFGALATVISPPQVTMEELPRTEEDEEPKAPGNKPRTRTYQPDRTYSKTILSTGGQRGRKG